jgi:hypothetical protein
MRKLLWAPLAALLLCGFGPAPFWGEARTPAAGGGSGPEISGSVTNYSENTSSDPSASTTYDATGADMLLVASCVLKTTSSTAISGSTTPTFNGTSMTQLAVSTNPGGSQYADCAIWVLDSPDQGSYTWAVTWDADVYSSWNMFAKLIDTASTQNGDTDVDDNGNRQTTSAVTLTPTAADNLLVHIGVTRGGDIGSCTMTGTTEITEGVTDTNQYEDLTFCAGTAVAADTSPVNSTLTFAGDDRVASVGVEIVAP